MDTIFSWLQKFLILSATLIFSSTSQAIVTENPMSPIATNDTIIQRIIPASTTSWLTTEQPFTLNAFFTDQNTIELNWHIAPKALLYKNKISNQKFTLQRARTYSSIYRRINYKIPLAT
jgi:thiol:disulfide interchange protein